MSDYSDGLAVLRARAAASSPPPAADTGRPSAVGPFLAALGGGLAVMLGWATGGHISSAIRNRRRRPLLLDQHGRPIERGRR